MKLIMENWRKFLSESPVTKLRIFDFDETIAFTDSEVRVVTPEGKRLAFDDQLKYDVYVKQQAKYHNIPTVDGAGRARDAVGDLMELGYEFDFDDFENVNNPKMNEKVVKILGRVVGANRLEAQREVYVMTARGPGAKIPILTYLMSLRQDSGVPRFEERDFTDIITLAGGSKQKAIEDLIQKHSVNGETTIKELSFFDDSQRNLDDVMQLVDKYPSIDFAIEKVEGAEITRLSEEELEEAGRCTKVTKKASSTRKGKKWMKCVKSDSGGYKRIHWGQKGVRVTGKSGNTKRKKSFKARHNCSKAKSNTPQGQACKDWAEQ